MHADYFRDITNVSVIISLTNHEKKKICGWLMNDIKKKKMILVSIVVALEKLVIKKKFSEFKYIL